MRSKRTHLLLLATGGRARASAWVQECLAIEVRTSKNITLLAINTYGGIGAYLAVEGATMKTVFEADMEGVLALTLRPGHIVVMDNLVVPKIGKVRVLVFLVDRYYHIMAGEVHDYDIRR